MSKCKIDLLSTLAIAEVLNSPEPDLTKIINALTDLNYIIDTKSIEDVVALRDIIKSISNKSPEIISDLDAMEVQINNATPPTNPPAPKKAVTGASNMKPVDSVQQLLTDIFKGNQLIVHRLVNDFVSKIIQNTLIDFEGGRIIKTNEDLSENLLKYYNSLGDSDINLENLTSSDFTDMLNDDGARLQEVISKVIKDNFDSLITSYSAGLITFNSAMRNKYDKVEGVTKYSLNSHNSYSFAWGNDNFNVLDETPRLTKMLIANTPRLAYDEDEGIIQTSKRLEINEVTNVMSKLKNFLSELSFDDQAYSRFNLAKNTKDLIISMLLNNLVKLTLAEREVLLTVYNFYYKQYEDMDIEGIDLINFDSVQSVGMIAYNEYERMGYVKSSPIYGSIPVFVDEMVSKEYSGMILNDDGSWAKDTLKSIQGGQLSNQLVAQAINMAKSNDKYKPFYNYLKKVKFSKDFEDMKEIYDNINSYFPQLRLTDNGYAVAKELTSPDFDKLKTIFKYISSFTKSKKDAEDNLRSNIISNISTIAGKINNVIGSQYKATIKTLDKTTVPTIALINTISDDMTNFAEIAYVINSVSDSNKDVAEEVPVSHNLFCQIIDGDFLNVGKVSSGQIRTTVYDPKNDQSKAPDKMNAAELYTYGILGDFLANLTSGKVNFQPVTFSDKKMQHTKQYDIGQIFYYNGVGYNLADFDGYDYDEVLTDLHYESVGNQFKSVHNIAVRDLNKVFRHIQKTDPEFLIRAAIKSINKSNNVDINTLIGEGGEIVLDENHNGILEQKAKKEYEGYLKIIFKLDYKAPLDSKQLDKLLRLLSASQLSSAGHDIDIPITSNVHYSGKGGRIKFNAVLQTEMDSYKDKESHKLRMDRARMKFLADLLNDGMIINVLNPDGTPNLTLKNQLDYFCQKVLRALNSSNFIKEWVNPSGELIIAKDKDGNPLHYSTWNQSALYERLNNRKDGFTDYTINPLLNYYFKLFNLLNTNYNLATMGGTFGHDIKINTDKSTPDQIIAASTTAADKRMVAEQATFHTNNTGALDALPFEFNTAVIEDRSSKVFNKIGQSENFAVGDGSALWCGFGMVLANNGMVSAQEEGSAKKFIHHQFNPNGCISGLEKYAAFTINNEMCRTSSSAIVGDSKTGVSAKSLLKKMSDRPIEGLDLFTEGYRDGVLKPTGRPNTYTFKVSRPITYREGNNLLLVLLIEDKGNGKAILGLQVTTPDDNSYNIVKEIDTPKSVYDMWELFGSENSLEPNPEGKFKFNGESYSYSENSRLLAAEFMVNYMKPKDEATPNLIKTLNAEYYHQPFKDNLIYLLNNYSGMKSGTLNVNPVSSWYDDKPLMSFKMNTAHFGVQGMFSHDFSEEHASEVTEMSQVISAAEAMGNESPEVRRLYNNLNSVVKATMLKYTKNLKDYNELSAMMTLEMIKLLSDKDEISFANTYLKNIKAQAKKLQLESSLELFQAYLMADNAPFSDNNIFNAMISMMRGQINRTAIKRKYPGIAAILIPGFDSYFVQDTETGTKLSDTDLGEPSYTPLADFNDVNEYDTYKVEYTDGKTEVMSFKDPAKYYEFLYSGKDNILSISKMSNFPRNLMGTRVVFTTADGKEFTRNDFDSTKAFYALNEYDDLQSELNDLEKFYGSILNELSPATKTDYEFKKSIILANILTLEQSPLFQSLRKLVPLINNEPELNKYISKNKKEILKTLRYAQQKELNDALRGVFSHLKDGSEVIYDINTSISPAELLLPNINKYKFGIEEGVQLSEINLDYFIRKIRQSLNSPDRKSKYDLWSYDLKGNKLLMLNYEAAHKLPKVDMPYDEIFDEEGESMGLYYLDSTGKPICKFSENVHFVLNGSELTLSYKEISDLQDIIEDPQFKYSGLDFNFGASNIVDLLSNLDEKLYDDLVITEGDVEVLDEISLHRMKKDKDLYNKRQARKIYGSWMKSLEIIGARIPAQSLQSFMAMRVVGFLAGNTNTAITPIEKNWLDGSDFDIDKIYLMTFSVNKNGILAVQGGKFFNWEFINESLDLPFQRETEDLNFTTLVVEYNLEDPINKHALALLNWVEEDPNEDRGKRREEWKAVVEALNYVNETNSIPYFKSPDPNDLNNIVSKVNSYFSQQFNNDDARLEASKNAVVHSLLKISGSIANMMNNERPVDMDDTRGAAKGSVMGLAAEYLERENPAAILKMIVEQQAGKSVTGIAAVAEKVFFNYSHLINLNLILADKKIKEIISQGGDPTEEAFKIFGKNSPKVRYDLNKKAYIPTLIANASFKNMPQLEYYYNKWIEYLAKGNPDATVLDVRTLEDGSLTISAVLSSATDNAKELILSKINAGPDLAGTYLTMVMQGIPFSDIAKFMTSPVINAVVKKANGNIFTGSQSNIDQSIQYFLEGVNPFDHLDIKEIQALIKFAYGSKKVEKRAVGLSYREYFNSLDQNLIILALRNVEEVKVVLKRGDIDLDIAGKSEMRNISIKANKLADQMEHRESLIKQSGLSAEDFNNTLKQFSEYKSIAEETELAGRRLGINQGMKGTLYDLYKFDYNFNYFIYKKFKQSHRSFRDYLSGDFSVNSTIEFCDIKAAHLKSLNGDHAHKNALIAFYEDVKDNINIVEAEFLLPHINAMLESSYETTEMFAVAAKYRAILKSLSYLAWALFPLGKEGFEYSFSELEFKRISRFFDNYLVTEFLENSKLTVDVYLYYDNLLETDDLDELQTQILDNADSKANFKRTFEDIIELLRLQFPENKFLNNLIFEDKSNMITGSNFSKIRMAFNTSTLTDAKENHGANTSPSALEYQELKQSLQLIKDSITATGQSFLQMLELYNILLNNNNYGDDTFTRILNDMMKEDSNFKENSLSLRYMEFVSRMEKQDLLHSDDVKLRLMVNLAYKKDKFFKDPSDLDEDETFQYKYVKSWNASLKKFDIQMYDSSTKSLKPYTLGNENVSDQILDSFLTTADLAREHNAVVSLLQKIEDFTSLMKEGYIRVITNC